MVLFTISEKKNEINFKILETFFLLASCHSTPWYSIRLLERKVASVLTQCCTQEAVILLAWQGYLLVPEVIG